MRHTPAAALALLLLFLVIGCEEEANPPPVGPSNTAPVIDSISVSATIVQAGHPVTLIASASDEDGDSLTFSWLSQHGGFIGRQTDTLAIWTPPYAVVNATIFLMVSDKKTTVKDSVTISVTGLDDRIPISPSPEDMATDVMPYLTLSWEVEAGDREPLTYDVYLSSGQNLLRVAENLSSTEWQVGNALQPGVQYRWRVAARPASGEEIFSEIFHFTTRALTYGPPLGDVAFKNFHNYIATWSTEGGAYLRRVGTENFLRNPSTTLAWNPGYSSSTSPAFALYDRDAGSLYLLSEDGLNRKEVTGALPSNYAFSQAGSRIAYTRPGTGTRQELLSDGVPPITGSSIYGTIDTPWAFSSRPSYSINGSSIAIALVNTEVPNTGRLTIFSVGNEIIYSRVKRIWSPQYNTTGTNVAWLEANSGGATASHLFIGSTSLAVQDSIEVESFGSNVTSFSWSPDGTKIAMFARIFTEPPALLVYDLLDNEITELTLPNPIVIPTRERQYVRPEWSSDSSEFTVCVTNNNQYLLLAVTPQAGTRVLVGMDELTEPVYAVWR